MDRCTVRRGDSPTHRFVHTEPSVLRLSVHRSCKQAIDAGRVSVDLDVVDGVRVVQEASSKTCSCHPATADSILRLTTYPTPL